MSSGKTQAGRRDKSNTTLETVLYEVTGAVAHVTVNSTKVLNSLNAQEWRDLQNAFEWAQCGGSVRGVILAGGGDKAFIAGGRHQ